MAVNKKSLKRLIVALDLEEKKKLNKIVKDLSGYIDKFKIGLIAYTKFGPQIITQLKSKGFKIFLDLKLFDIPNTVINTAKIFAQMEVWAFTVHLKMGENPLTLLKKELTSFCRKNKLKKPLILGVTELTSEKAPLKNVLKLTDLAFRVGLEGVIASPQEAPFIRRKYPKLKIITPGIRPPDYKQDDQRRVSSASFALNYADFIVVGRPIIKAKHPLAAVKKILGC